MNRRGRLEVQEISDLSSLAKLEPEWNELWERCPGATPFQRPEWLICWMATFHPGELWTLIVRDSGRLMGIAPMYVQTKGAERTLAPVGAAISDYLDWLLDPDISQDVLAYILTYMQQRDSFWSSFDFSDVPCNSPLLNLTLEKNYELEVKSHDFCPVLQLPQTVGELRNVVPRHQLRSLKSGRKKLEKAGQVRFEVATRESLDGLLDGLFHLHQTRWSHSGEVGVLADEDVRQFHRAVTPALLNKGVLRLYGLRFNHRIIASLYALFENETAYCYLQGFDPEFADFSPGSQMLFAVIEDGVREHKRSIDFLRGREAYKYAWGARDVPTYRIRAQKAVSLKDTSDRQIAA